MPPWSSVPPATPPAPDAEDVLPLGHPPRGLRRRRDGGAVLVWGGPLAVVITGRDLNGNSVNSNRMECHVGAEARVLDGVFMEGCGGWRLVDSLGREWGVGGGGGGGGAGAWRAGTPLLSARFSEDGLWLATASFAGMHVISGDASFPVPRAHVGAVFALAWNADATLLASGGEDRLVCLHRCRREQQPLSIEKVWTAMGSRGRVWSVAFWSGGLVSAGEDAVVRVWDGTHGRAVRDLIGHGCKNIWFCEVDQDDILVTGGSNGVKQWDLRALAAPAAAQHTGNFALLWHQGGFTDGPVVAITNEWRLSMFRGKDVVAPSVLLAVPGMHHSDQPAAMCLAGDRLAVGTKRGRFLVYEVDPDNTRTLTAVLPPPTFPVCHLPTLHHREATCVYWFPRHEGQEWFVGCGDGAWTCVSKEGKRVSTSRLPFPNSYVTCVADALDVCVFGDSKGRLYAYSTTSWPSWTLKASWHRAHGLQAVTVVRAVPRTGASVLRFMSGGENGVVLEFEFLAEERRFVAVAEYSKLGPIHVVRDVFFRVPNGVWVSGSVGTELFLWDLHESHTVVVPRLPAKRFHAFLPGMGLMWLDTNRSIRYLECPPERVTSRTVPGSTQACHARMVWACAFMGPERVVTASEDETLGVWELVRGGTLPRLVTRCEAHMAAVRCVDSIEVGAAEQEGSFVLVSGGGRGTLVVNRFLPRTGELRLVGVRREDVDHGREGGGENDEHRVMCVRWVPRCAGTRFVAGTADGTMREFHVERGGVSYAGTRSGGATSSTTVLLTEAVLVPGRELTRRHRPYCVLTASVVEASGLVVVWGDTFGGLMVASMDEEKEQALTVKAHQCGTNALAVASVVGEEATNIISGGDDQAISVSCYCAGTLNLVATFPGMVAAAVVGLYLVEGGEEAWVLSGDQRLTVWRVVSGRSWEKREERMTGVPETSGMAVCGGGLIIAVCGDGWRAGC